MENLWEGVGMPWAVDSHTITKSYSNPILPSKHLEGGPSGALLAHLVPWWLSLSWNGTIRVLKSEGSGATLRRRGIGLLLSGLDSFNLIRTTTRGYTY